MVIKKTKSLCPECLEVIDAEVYEEHDKIMIKKECKEHGEFDSVYWTNDHLYHEALDSNHKGQGVDNPQTAVLNECPLSCGLCPEHESHTVLGIIDVTNRCNLRCPVCFANAAVTGYLYEPSYDEIKEMLLNLKSNEPVAAPAIQFSGGEPTIRKDIVELVKLAKEMEFSHTQIATNGIKLAKDPELAGKLKEAGLNTIYLQFDGVTEEPYIETRGKNLLPLKLEAIENCRASKLGIVLVPTLVKGINDHQIGDIIRFAVDNIEIIRGVNFQPVSFAGRTSAEEMEKQRITLPDFEKAVEKQTNSKIKVKDFYPASSVVPISEFIEALEGSPQVTITCHPHCGAATYIFVEDGEIIPINRFINVDRFFNLLSDSSDDIKEGGRIGKAKVMARSLKELPKTVNPLKTPKSIEIKKILFNVFKDKSYSSLGNFHYKTLLIACMHFMDPWNFDKDRVRRCVIHYAVPDGRIIPFCSMNALYREDIERKHSIPLKKD
ncbi:MAG: radical SAM protein [Euryarchaeota archaeon]|nr:radical SAM protein [Euryarchaeota archaeon]